MTETRRRSRRHPTDWAARFRLDPGAAWRSCRVIDVSWDGAALELHDVDDAEELVGRMFVDVAPVTGEDDGIRIDGTIRHRARTATGRTLVGMEFRRLDREQLKLLQALVSLHVAV